MHSVSKRPKKLAPGGTVTLGNTAPSAAAPSRAVGDKMSTRVLLLLLGAALGAVGALGANLWLHSLLTPALSIRYALGVREAKEGVRGDSAELLSTMTDAQTNCVVVMVRGATPRGNIHLAGPRVQAFAKLLLTNSGRSQATDVHIGITFKAPGRASVTATPNISLAHRRVVLPDADATVDELIVERLAPHTTAVITYRVDIDSTQYARFFASSYPINFPFLTAAELSPDDIRRAAIDVLDAYTVEAELAGSPGPKFDIPIRARYGSQTQFRVVTMSGDTVRRSNLPACPKKPRHPWLINVLDTFGFFKASPVK